LTSLGKKYFFNNLLDRPVIISQEGSELSAHRGIALFGAMLSAIFLKHCWPGCVIKVLLTLAALQRAGCLPIA